MTKTTDQIKKLEIKDDDIVVVNSGDLTTKQTREIINDLKDEGIENLIVAMPEGVSIESLDIGKDDYVVLYVPKNISPDAEFSLLEYYSTVFDRQIITFVNDHKVETATREELERWRDRIEEVLEAKHSTFNWNEIFNFYTTEQVLKITGIKRTRLDYLVRSNQIPVVLRGKGRQRWYPPEVFKAIDDIEGKGGSNH